jgi:hypothetical protein
MHRGARSKFPFVAFWKKIWLNGPIFAGIFMAWGIFSDPMFVNQKCSVCSQVGPIILVWRGKNALVLGSGRIVITFEQGLPALYCVADPIHSDRGITGGAFGEKFWVIAIFVKKLYQI